MLISHTLCWTFLLQDDGRLDIVLRWCWFPKILKVRNWKAFISSSIEHSRNLSFADVISWVFARDIAAFFVVIRFKTIHMSLQILVDNTIKTLQCILREVLCKILVQTAMLFKRRVESLRMVHKAIAGNGTKIFLVPNSLVRAHWCSQHILFKANARGFSVKALALKTLNAESDWGNLCFTTIYFLSLF